MSVSVSQHQAVAESGCELAALPVGKSATVHQVSSVAESASLSRRLAEIGFLPGEQVQVLTRATGGFPLVVRVGTSTFALRRHEAAAVRVLPK